MSERVFHTLVEQIRDGMEKKNIKSKKLKELLSNDNCFRYNYTSLLIHHRLNSKRLVSILYNILYHFFNGFI